MTSFCVGIVYVTNMLTWVSLRTVRPENVIRKLTLYVSQGGFVVHSGAVDRSLSSSVNTALMALVLCCAGVSRQQ